MTSRERVLATIEHREVDRIPRQQWNLPYVFMHRKDEFDKIEAEFPSDFGYHMGAYGVSHYRSGTPNVVGGNFIDDFGNVWSVKEEGIVGEVSKPILANLEKLDSYEMPYEILNNADFSLVNESCAKTDKFVLAGTMTNPFERMQQIHGTENLFVDLALDTPEIYTLRDMFHAFSVREMKMWAETNVDGVSFMDDWGTQRALLISPDKWRSFYKPLYKEYCDILHAAGKKVFFHSDGNIEAIYPDLIEIGIDALNSQLFCMNIEELGERYAGKITFWGEIDRQHIMPFGTKQDVHDAVDRVASAMLKKGRSGVIAQCEWGRMEPFENVRAVFSQWNKY
jgi:uroporphyrinogen decarboxylase